MGVARRWNTSDSVTAAATALPPAFIDASPVTPSPVARHVLRSNGSTHIEPLTPPKDATGRHESPRNDPVSNDSNTRQSSGGQSPSRSSSLASRVSQQRQRSADNVAMSSSGSHRGQSQPGSSRHSASGSGTSGSSRHSGAEQRHVHSISPRRPRVPPTSDAGFPSSTSRARMEAPQQQHSSPSIYTEPSPESLRGEAKHSPGLRSEAEAVAAPGTVTRASRSTPRRPAVAAAGATAGFPSRLLSPGAPSAVASEKQGRPSTPPQQQRQQSKELHRSWPRKPPAPTSAPPKSAGASGNSSSSTGEIVNASPWAAFLNRGPAGSRTHQSGSDHDSPSTPAEESKAGGATSSPRSGFGGYRSRRATADSVLTGTSQQKPRWAAGGDEGQSDPVTSPIVRTSGAQPHNSERRHMQLDMSPPAVPPPHTQTQTPPPAPPPPPSFARVFPSPSSAAPGSSGKLPKPPLPTTAPPPNSYASPPSKKEFPSTYEPSSEDASSSPPPTPSATAAARRADLLRAAHTKFATPVSPTGSRSAAAVTAVTTMREAEAAAAAAATERNENGGAASSRSGHSRASSSDMPETEVPEPGNISEQSHEDMVPNPVAAVRSAMMPPLKNSNAPSYHRSSSSPGANHRRRGGSNRNSHSPPESSSMPSSTSSPAANATAAAAAALGSSDEESDALALMEGFLAAVAAGASCSKSTKGAMPAASSSVATAAAAHLAPLHTALAGALKNRALAAQTFERVLVEEQAVLDAAAAQQTLLGVRKNPTARVKGQLLTKYQDAHVVLLEQVRFLVLVLCMTRKIFYLLCFLSFVSTLTFNDAPDWGPILKTGYSFLSCAFFLSISFFLRCFCPSSPL